MADVCYKKLISEIFGPQLDEQNPISDIDGLAKAVEAALATLTPEQQAAVKAVCFEGKEADKQTYAMALRSLKHPSCSRTLRAYLKFKED